MRIITSLFLINIFSVFLFFSTVEETKVEMVTTHGTIVVKLYDETPLHRDNFIKLAQDGVYDSLLFHRVITGFMIQAGDIKSKNAAPGERLGSTDLGYTVPAEIRPDLFHKRGVLAAARNNNPTRASSSTQFYLVQGIVHNDSLLDYEQGRINTRLRQHAMMNDPEIKPLMDSLSAANRRRDVAVVNQITSQLDSIERSYSKIDKYIIPEAHRQVYKEIGGKPHLDQNYTVFGEIISGLQVVDSIAAVQTDSRDRPIANVRILSMRIVEK
ncbi:peptidylprolyl isomerase [Algoriphagus namhaensis]|uniref:peptidylprolyl isomerase n=1 Tax=Algoriphagus namhaensis TaxID=915353 RepID=A0ABV8AP07_9BACT